MTVNIKMMRDGRVFDFHKAAELKAFKINGYTVFVKPFFCQMFCATVLNEKNEIIYEHAEPFEQWAWNRGFKYLLSSELISEDDEIQRGVIREQPQSV